jgi:hypothetical protein
MLALANEWLGCIQKPADGTRPSRNTSPGSGVSFTQGASHAEGSYAQILDGSTEWPAGFGDGMLLELRFANTSVSAQAASGLATIGIDPSGGTSYTEWIHDLVCGPTGNHEDGSICYQFPIRVPNGASLAVKAQSSNASPPSNADLALKIYGKPTRPELVRVGSYVRTIGADPGTSYGTLLTPGTTSDGSWSELTSSPLADPIWGWEYCMLIDDDIINSNAYNIDLAVGDGSTFRRVLRNRRMASTTSETIIKHQFGFDFGDAAVGDRVWSRVQAGDQALITSYAMIAYGIGG